MEEEKFKEKVIELLGNIDLKLGRLENDIRNLTTAPPQGQKEAKTPLDVDVLLSLPDHLRKTAMVVSARGSATAEEASVETGRTRAAESDYMNQLVKMGYLSKRRKGRTVHFYA